MNEEQEHPDELAARHRSGSGSVEFEDPALDREFVEQLLDRTSDSVRSRRHRDRAPWDHRRSRMLRMVRPAAALVLYAAGIATGVVLARSAGSSTSSDPLVATAPDPSSKEAEAPVTVKVERPEGEDLLLEQRNPLAALEHYRTLLEEPENPLSESSDWLLVALVQDRKRNRSH